MKKQEGRRTEDCPQVSAHGSALGATPIHFFGTCYLEGSEAQVPSGRILNGRKGFGVTKYNEKICIYCGTDPCSFDSSTLHPNFMSSKNLRHRNRFENDIIIHSKIEDAAGLASPPLLNVTSRPPTHPQRIHHRSIMFTIVFIVGHGEWVLTTELRFPWPVNAFFGARLLPPQPVLLIAGWGQLDDLHAVLQPH